MKTELVKAARIGCATGKTVQSHSAGRSGLLLPLRSAVPGCLLGRGGGCALFYFCLLLRQKHFFTDLKLMLISTVQNRVHSACAPEQPEWELWPCIRRSDTLTSSSLPILWTVLVQSSPSLSEKMKGQRKSLKWNRLLNK